MKVLGKRENGDLDCVYCGRRRKYLIFLNSDGVWGGGLGGRGLFTGADGYISNTNPEILNG